MTIQKEQDGTTKVTFRIPSELYERIKSAARYSGRTLNSEAITWLQQRDIGNALEELKVQNQELRRMVLETLEAVSGNRK